MVLKFFWQPREIIHHPDTLVSLNNLAVFHKAQGNYSLAQQLYEKNLKVREEILGVSHPSTLSSLNNLAGLYHAQGNYSLAQELYKKSLRLREEILAESHPDT